MARGEDADKSTVESDLSDDNAQGRPLLYESLQDDPMQVYAIRMTAWHARQFRRQSDSGQLSEGARIAIETLVKQERKGPSLG